MAFQWPPFVPATGYRSGFTYLPHYVDMDISVSGNQLKITFSSRWSPLPQYHSTTNGQADYIHPMAGYDQYGYYYPLSLLRASMTNVYENVSWPSVVGREGQQYTSQNGVTDSGGADTITYNNVHVDHDFNKTYSAVMVWTSTTSRLLIAASDISGAYAIVDATGMSTTIAQRCCRMCKVTATKYFIIWNGTANTANNFRYCFFDTTTNTLTAPATMPTLESSANLEQGFELFDAGEGYYYITYVVSGNMYIRGIDATGVTPVVTAVLGGSGGAAFNGSTGSFAYNGTANNTRRYVTVGTNRVIAFMGGNRFVRMTFTAAAKTTPTVVTSVRTSSGSGNQIYMEYDPTNTSQFYLVRWTGAAAATVTFYGEYINVLGDISSNFQGYQLVYSSYVGGYDFTVTDAFGGSAASGEGHLSALGVYFNTTDGTYDHLTSTTFAYSCWHTPVLYELSVNATSTYTSASIVGRIVIAQRGVEINSAYTGIAIGLALPSFSVDRFMWTLSQSTIYEYTVDIVSSYTSVTLTGLSVRIVEALPLTQYWLNVGHTWMDDFMTYLNQDRFAAGMPRYKTWGEDGLYTLRRDVAQLHASAMAWYRIYQHESASLPAGTGTIVERSDLMPTSGISENILLDAVYNLKLNYANGNYPPANNGYITPYAAWLAWHNSPGHYANMTRNWGDQNGIVYSLMGAGEGAGPISYAPHPPESVAWTVDWSCLYLCNNFAALEITMYEIPLEQYWANSGALISALDQEWSNDSWSHVAARHEVPYSIRVASLSYVAMWGCRVAAQHSAPITYSAAAQHSAPYEPTLPIPKAVHEAQYAIKNTTTVAVQSESPFALLVAAVNVAAYSIRVPVIASHEAGYMIRNTTTVSAQHEVTFSLSVAAQASADYAITVPVSASNEAGYRIRNTEPVAAQHESSFALSVAAQASFDYAVTTPVRAGHEAGYRILNTQPVAAQHDAGYGLSVAAQSEAVWTVNTTVRAQNAANYGDISPVRTQAQLDYALLQNNPIKVSMAHYYAMQEYVSQLASNNLVTLVLADGQALRLSDGVIDSSSGEVGYSFECSIDDIDTFSRIQEDDPIVVDFCGELYNFLVKSKSMSRDGPANITMRISADNAVVRTGQPYAQETTYVQENDITASALVDNLVEIDFNYEIVDWTILGGRLQVAGATSLEAVSQIAEATGGVVDGTPEGVMRLRYPYPYPMPDLGVAPVDQNYSDSYDNLSVSVSTEYRDGADRFRIREGDSAFSDSLEWVPDEKQTDPLYQTGIVKAYLSPYRTTASISHLGNAAYVIPIGEEIEYNEELIEFNKGVGNTRRPIETLLSVEWYTASMGTPSYSPFSTLLNVNQTVNNGYGLAKVRYNAKHLTAKAGGVPASVQAGDIGPASSYAYFILEESNG